MEATALMAAQPEPEPAVGATGALVVQLKAGGCKGEVEMLADGSLVTFKSRAGQLLRRADVSGAAVSETKLKGFEAALEVKLATPDSEGSKKFVVGCENAVTLPRLQAAMAGAIEGAAAPPAPAAGGGAAAAAAEEEGEPVGPLDAEVVCIVSADADDGELVSFNALAQMLSDGKLNGEDKVFVPPVGLLTAAAISTYADMDSVSEMDAEDMAELAEMLRDQLTPKDAKEEALEQDVMPNALIFGDEDDIDRACAACAPPLNLTHGAFRCPIELPEPLRQQAERQLGETTEVREAACIALREQLVQLERDGIGKGKKHKTIVFPRKDDQFLVAFLRCKKFRVDDACKTIVKYCAS